MNTFRFPVIREEMTGRRLREMRKKSGVTVTALCSCLGGISEQAVYKWERGACLPSLDNLLALSRLYHVRMEELLVYEEADEASSFWFVKTVAIYTRIMYNGKVLNYRKKRGILMRIYLLMLAAIAAAVLMGICLAHVLKRTLYSFKAVELIAGLIFCAAVLVEIGLYAVIQGPGALTEPVADTFRMMVRFTQYFTHLSTWVLLVLSILMSISNLSLMRHEGKSLRNIYGAALGGSMIAATLILHYLSDLSENYMLAAGENATEAAASAASPVVRIFFGFILPFLYIMLCYVECVMGGIILMGWKASRQVPAYDKDFIIILGCSISKNGGLLPLLRQRVNRAMRYAWEQEIATGKRVFYVPSGGQGADEVISEGSAMALYLESHSAEESEVFAEKQSRNTWENFCFSRKIILAQKPDAKVAFATTNYHILRSGMLARKAGFKDIEAIASATKWYFWPNGFAREVIGIWAMTWKTHAIAAVVAAALCLTGVMRW